MSGDLDRLEQEVERELARWGPRLDVRPAEQALGRAQQACRLELDEAWLRSQPAPSPSPEVMARVRSAVAAELARSGRRIGLSWPRWLTPQATGSIAAAAVLLICVGVVRLAGPGAGASATAAVEVDELLAAADRMWTGSPADDLEEAVRSIEDDLSGDAAGDDAGDSLEEMLLEMDELLEDEAAGGNRAAVPPEGGAWG